jgi:hypothetical protein
MLMLANKVDRPGKWLHQVAEKLGVKLSTNSFEELGSVWDICMSRTVLLFSQRLNCPKGFIALGFACKGSNIA